MMLIRLRFDDRPQVDGPVVKSLRVAVRGADDEGQDDWISPALPPLAMIKQARLGVSVVQIAFIQCLY